MSALTIFFILAFCLAATHAFHSSIATSRYPLNLYMGGSPKPSGLSSTKEGKAVIIERTKALLVDASMIITCPAEGISKEQIDILKKALPKSTKVSVVKNRLFALSVKDTQFEVMVEKKPLKQANMFFFIPEGDAKVAYKSYNVWRKEALRLDEKFDAKIACMDGVVYEGSNNIQTVTNLPTRLELITKIAQGIKLVPTKIGLGVKAVPNKLGKAFKLYADKLAEEAEGPVAVHAEVEAVAEAPVEVAAE